MQVVGCHAHLGGDFVFRGRATQTHFQFIIGPLKGFHVVTDGTGYPVLLSEHLQNCASNQSDRIGLELHLAIRIELVNSLDQSHDTGADQVITLQVGRQTGHYAACGDF